MAEQNTFITNQEKLLSDIIKGILPKSKTADVLVGYFYFSGYKLISEQLKDKDIRILVGLDVDTHITKTIREIETFVKENRSRGQIKEEYFRQFVRLFNETDFLDCSEKLNSFKLFYEKIQNGSLEIRKTEDPCHAKMYVFSYKDEISENGEVPGTVITGSSNLSYEGLAGRIEINARFNDKQSVLDAQIIFNDLWEKSVVIADQNNVDEFNSKVIEHIWYEKLYSPYLLYIRVLQEYFSIPIKENLLAPSDITDGKFTDLKYQLDAVQLSLNAIENHNGVIVADVVGLGKSIIASTVARNLKMRTIIVSPPHLVSQWNDYKDEFKFTASVFSCGKMDDALNHYKRIVNDNEQFLVIVDEAHRYRNEYTQDYALLHQLCSGNKVMLLTATPFNNRPADIYSMLKLFQIPTKSTLKTVDDLGAAFKSLIAQYEQLRKENPNAHGTEDSIRSKVNEISAEIRHIINPLVVRRSRLDLLDIPEYAEDLKKQGFELVVPNDPVELDYNLGSLKNLYLTTLEKINPETEGNDDKDRFQAARYSPILYVKGELRDELKKELEEKTGVEFNLLVGRQTNVSKFMRRLLVRRFESSVAAFQSSLAFMIQSSENILSWIDKCHKIPIYKKGRLLTVEDIYASTNDGLTEIVDAFEKYSAKGFFEIDMKYIKEDFKTAVQKDISLLKQVQNEWFGQNNKITFDPKLEAFKRILSDNLQKNPQRKLIVFTEFSDTADYLGKCLQNAGLPVFKYTSSDSSINNKEIIRANFDAGLKQELQCDNYKILVATDAISEGYNLHRAGTIFNYDIPYNPTRVIQRIGRINRINKKVFDELHIYNFFPTDVGEKETHTKAISTLKMAMIHAVMGEDTKVLTANEEPHALFVKQYKEAMAKDESASWDNKYRKLLGTLKSQPYYANALVIPHRGRTGRNASKPLNGVLIFGKKGNDYVFKIGNDKGITSLSAEEALPLFEALPEEKPIALSSQFDVLYQKIKINLFKNNAEDKNEKERLEASQKVQILQQKKALDKDYLADLMIAIRNDSLSGYELRYIKNLIPKEYSKLPSVIEHSYLIRSIATYNRIEEGEETLILTEELQKKVKFEKSK